MNFCLWIWHLKKFVCEIFGSLYCIYKKTIHIRSVPLPTIYSYVALCTQGIWLLLSGCRLCLGAWSDHGGRTGGFCACNRYESAKQQGDAREIFLFLIFSSSFLQISVSKWRWMRFCSLTYNFHIFACSMMRLRGEEGWQIILWRNTLAITTDGQAINQ